MPFGNIATFYPTAASLGLWGTDVRALQSAVPGLNSTTKTDHSTGGAVVRTVDPYTTSTTDGTQADFGWAIDPTDMGSVAGAKRFFGAGNHVATVRMGHNGATGVTATLFMYVYRVGPAAGRTRTLLGSNSATFDLPAASGDVTATVTVALPEVIFEVDETVQYSFEISCAGIALVGRVLTFYTGTQSGVAVRVDTPTLRVLADTTGTVNNNLGTATGVGGKVLATVGSVANNLGTASGVGASMAGTTGTATGLGTATGVLTGIGGMTGTAVGSGVALATATGIGSMTGTAVGSGVAAGAMGAIGGMTGTAGGSGTATGVLGGIGGMTGSASGSGAAAGQMSSLSGTIGTASGSGTAAGVGGAVVGAIGTVEIGSGSVETTIIKKIFPMFGD